MNTALVTKQKTKINGIKKYINTYIFSFAGKFNFKKDKNAWRKYVIPSKKKKENISENIDKILY